MAKGLRVKIEHRSALCEGNSPVLPLTSHTGWLLVADVEQAPLHLSLHLPFTNSPFTLPLTSGANSLVLCPQAKAINCPAPLCSNHFPTPLLFFKGSPLHLPLTPHP